jgi:hypothetical protein
MQNPTLVVLTDRNDLDDQLFGQFQRCHDLLGQMPLQAAESRAFGGTAEAGERRRGIHNYPQIHARGRRTDVGAQRTARTSWSSPMKRIVRNTVSAGE